MFYFAFLNEEDIVTQIVMLPSLIVLSQYINIPADDQTLIGKKYNRTTGQFEKIEKLVQVTEEEKQFMMGIPVAEIYQEDAFSVAGRQSQEVVVPFDTKRPGYLPRRVYLQFNHTFNNGSVSVLNQSTILVMERKEDGSIRYWMDFPVFESSGVRAKGYLDTAIFEYSKHTGPRYINYGGYPFVDISMRDEETFWSHISKFSYDEKNIKFTCKSRNLETIKFKYKLQALIY